MKKENGISIIMLAIIVVIIIFGIICIIANNQGGGTVKIKWGYVPSSEYYELRLAATTSEVVNGTGTLSLSSFNTLGKDIKKARGKWFKNSNVNFKASVSDANGKEITTLTDGTHTATFTFDNVSNYVYYTFTNEAHTGYRITIK